MTELQIKILVIGIGVILVAVAVLIHRWVRKTYYEYNEYTGRVEPKSKVRTMEKWMDRSREKYLKKQEETKPKKPKYRIDKKEPRKYLPNEEIGDEMLLVSVIQMGKADGHYAMKFKSVTYGDEIALFVDEETFNSVKVGRQGFLCYNVKHNIFYYFDPMLDIADILPDEYL